MLYPKVDPAEWADRYNLPLKVIPCENCGEPQPLNIPIAFDNWRGLTAPLHACGEEFRAFVAVEIGPGGEEWKQLFSRLSEALEETES